MQLAQSRGAYEINWANLNLESSGWHLDQSALPITGAVDGTISVTPDAGTNFVPGWFSVPRLSEAGSASTSTSTGFNATDLDQYFTAGLMPDMPGADPVTSGKVSRDDLKFTSALGIPAQHEGNETKPTPQTVTVDEGDDPAHNPPTRRIPLVLVPNEQLAVADDVDGVSLPYLPFVPGGFDTSLPLLPPELIIDPVFFGSDPDAAVQMNPLEPGGRLRLSQSAQAQEVQVIIVVIDGGADGSVPAGSQDLACAELNLTELEMLELEEEAEELTEEIQKVAGEVTMEELFKPLLGDGGKVLYDWTAIQESFIEQYGEAGLAMLMHLHEQGWRFDEASYWTDGMLGYDAWPDTENSIIWLGTRDWLGIFSRSPENSAGQLYDAGVKVISDQEQLIRRYRQWELMERHYPWTTTWVLRLSDDIMQNVNSSCLEWWEGESLDGRKLSPEERSSRGWEFATSFGTLVLIGSGLKLPGGAAVAESMAGRSAMYRILHTPVEGVIAGGARSAAGAASAAGSALGRAVLSDTRIVALRLRLAAVEARLAQNGIGNSVAARAASKRYYDSVRKRLHALNPSRRIRNEAFPRGLEGDEFHHWLIPQRATWAPNWLKHNRLNFMRIRGTLHARIDLHRHGFLRLPFRNLPEFAPLGAYGRIWYGTPTWAKGAVVIIIYLEQD